MRSRSKDIAGPAEATSNAGPLAGIVGPLRQILSPVLVSERRRVGAIVLLQVAESIGVVAATYVFAFASRRFALALAVALGGAFVARRVVTAVLARRVRLDLIRRTTAAVLAADMTRPSLVRAGDTMLAVFEGLHFAERSVVDGIPGVVASVLASAMLAVLGAWAVSIPLLLTGAFAIVVAAGVMVVSREIVARHAAVAALASNRVLGAVAAAVEGRVDLVANGRDEQFLAMLTRDTHRWADVAMRADRVSALAGRAPLVSAVLAVVAIGGVDTALRGEMLALGLARSAVFASAVPPFLALARWAMQLAKDAAKLNGLAEILAADRSPPGAKRGTPLPPFPADVEWRAVSFCYRSDANAILALDDVSVTWSPAKSLLVVGPNGSGKSTFLRLLLGLFAPSAGVVTVGGRDVLSLDLHAWRACAAYLGQRPYILNRATVRETIAAMAPSAEDAQMKRALERLAVWTDLAHKSPDDPLSTSIGGLSVGQRQRVLVARVLAQNARLVVLDEPDANLDAAGVKIVAEVVRELARDRMVIVAAHTPELAAAGDIVVELDRGKVRSLIDHTSHDAGTSDGHRA